MENQTPFLIPREENGVLSFMHAGVTGGIGAEVPEETRTGQMGRRWKSREEWMNGKPIRHNVEPLESLIFTIRGQRVILDAYLARIYGVPTKALNQAIKRNADRFPSDFMLQLTSQEVLELTGKSATSSSVDMRSQFVTASKKRNIRLPPYALTEHGAVMAANVLNSPEAIRMSVFVVRAFVRMRSLLGDTRELARRLADLERELKERLDVHEVAIVNILQPTSRYTVGLSRGSAREH